MRVAAHVVLPCLYWSNKFLNKGHGYCPGSTCPHSCSGDKWRRAAERHLTSAGTQTSVASEWDSHAAAGSRSCSGTDDSYEAPACEESIISLSPAWCLYLTCSIFKRNKFPIISALLLIYYLHSFLFCASILFNFFLESCIQRVASVCLCATYSL